LHGNTPKSTFVLVIIIMHQVTDLQKTKIELRKVKKILIRGDQRELASLLGVHPNKVSDGFDGFVNDIQFLRRLQAEAQKLVDDRQTVNS